MRVRLKPDWRRIRKHKYRLTDGKEYVVLGIEADYYRIVNDGGEPVLFPPIIFQIVDRSVPTDWVSEIGTGGELYACPRELAEPGFFEDWHDGDEKARKVFHDYLAKIGLLGKLA